LKSTVKSKNMENLWDMFFANIVLLLDITIWNVR
jgi:hypothetical protein